MKPRLKDIPRRFEAAGETMQDFGSIELDSNEMITICTASGKQCDFSAKDWGFYLAPSLNSRLRDQGFKTALVINPAGKLFLNAVDVEQMEAFREYLKEQKSRLICWLDKYTESDFSNK